MPHFRGVEQRVVRRKDRSPRNTEDHLATDCLKRTDQRLGAGDTHRCARWRRGFRTVGRGRVVCSLFRRPGLRGGSRCSARHRFCLVSQWSGKGVRTRKNPRRPDRSHEGRASTSQ
nr:hypothetical protein [Kibdelosporangium sp. MJ126-NF4]